MKRNSFSEAKVVLAALAAVFLLAGTASAGSATTNLSFEEQHKDKSLIFLLVDTIVKVKEDWSYVTKVHIKTKVLNEEGKEMGEIPLPYTNGRTKLKDIKAFTITPDGKKHGYSKIQDLSPLEDFAMYSDSRVKIITFPEVNIGSVVEYEVTAYSKESPIKNAFFDEVGLSFSIPIKEMNVTYTFPKSLNIQYKEFNLDYKPKITKTASTITYSWHIEDAYTPDDEEALEPPPTPASIKNGVEFSSIKSWADVSSWYYGLIQKNLRLTPEIEAAAKKAAENKASLKDTTRAILEYMQDNFRYVSMSFGDNTLEPHPTDEVFKNKYGDCKDLSLLCMAMFKACGVKSSIALFRDEGSISDPQYDLPQPTLFNHVLLLVEDPKEGDFYIDPLLKGYDIGQYPLSYQSAYTFVITADGGKFGRLPVFTDDDRDEKKEFVITINEDGSELREATILHDLDSSIALRYKMNLASEEEKKKFYESMDAVGWSGEMLERRIDGLDNKYGPLKTYFKYTRKNVYPITDNMMIIDMDSNSGRSGLFVEKERKNPIFNKINSLRETITTYRIPEGFSISHMPEDFEVSSGFYTLKRKYRKKENEITLIETARFKRIELPKEEYQKVKDFYDQLPAKTKQRIILKRPKL